MDEVLGLLALAGYIAAIVGLAAGVTYTVIRIFPTERNPKKSDKGETSAGNGDSVSAGSLFRRSKRAKT